MSDFLKTVRLIVDHAIAKEEHRALAEELRERTLSFALKAASTSEAARLPEQPWQDSKRQMSMQVTAAEGRLNVTLQTQGYRAQQRYARRSARFSANIDGQSVIEQRFRFSAEGLGVVVVGDTPEIRSSLAAARLILDPDC